MILFWPLLLCPRPSMHARGSEAQVKQAQSVVAPAVVEFQVIHNKHHSQRKHASIFSIRLLGPYPSQLSQRPSPTKANRFHLGYLISSSETRLLPNHSSPTVSRTLHPSQLRQLHNRPNAYRFWGHYRVPRFDRETIRLTSLCSGNKRGCLSPRFFKRAVDHDRTTATYASSRLANVIRPMRPAAETCS